MLITELKNKETIRASIAGKVFIINCHGCREIYFPEKAAEEFQQELVKLYEQRIIPAVSKGLCAAIYTQVSDIEDETNGILTYDRKVCKLEEKRMALIAEALTK